MNSDKHYATAEQLLNVLDMVLEASRVKPEIVDDGEGGEDE